MNSTDVLNSARSAEIRSSTSASTVASSAVVGSSRISSAGSQASAIAITTRCAIPPDSSCGYRRMTRPGSEICTLRSICSALALASSLCEPMTVNASAICLPIRSDGLSARSGSWYTIDTVFARMVRRVPALKVSGS